MRLSVAIAVACLTTIGLSVAGESQASIKQYTEISPQELGPALATLAKDRDFQIVYVSEEIGAQRTNGAVGEFTAEEALRQLLNGTGLTYRYLDKKTITIVSTLGERQGVGTSGTGGDSSEQAPAGPDTTQWGGQSKSFWARFRVAQVDQGAPTVKSSSSSTASGGAKRAEKTESVVATEVSSRDTKLEEIIVTAQKRREDLQEVPISVQVISGLQLQEENQNSLSDLTRTLPGVHVATGGDSNTLYIRGIGSGLDNPGFDQSVAMFADDVYRGRSRLSEATFLDLDRVEVLKGPQSTYFGNSAIAGAINVISKKPGDTVEGYVRALGGMFEQYALEGAVGGPITDTLRARFAASATGNDRGWLTDVNSGGQVPRIHNVVGRLTVVYKPTEALDATLKLEGGQHKTEGASVDQPNQWRNCPYPPFPTSFGSAFDACGTVVALGLPVGIDQKNVSVLAGERNQLRNDEAILTINYRYANQTVTSVTGYSYYDYIKDAGSGLPLPVSELEDLEHYHQFSEELRLASATGQPIEYLVGAYVQTDELSFDDVITSPYLTPLFQAYPPVAPVLPYLPYAFHAGDRQSEHIYSVFGSLTWNATDRLKVSAGLRASKVDKDYTAHVAYGSSTQLYGGFVPDPDSIQQLISSTFGIALGTSPLLSRSDHALMPSARIQYQFNPRVMAYFRYDRGFLAGGFNGAGVFDFGNIAQFEPEYVNDYEVGLKSKWRDDTVLLNLNLFRGDYKDLQVSLIKFFYDPTSGTYTGLSDLGNAGKSRSQGVELEGQWLPVKDLTLGANITYLHAYFVSFPNSVPNTLQTYCSVGGGDGTPYCLAQFPAGAPQANDVTGQPTAYAPRWSGNVTAAYGITLPGDFRLTTEVDPYFTTSYYSVSGDPFFKTGGYVRWDARLAFGPQNGRWSLDLIGKNLTDRAIVVTQASYQQFSKEMPRNVALQFRYHL